MGWDRVTLFYYWTARTQTCWSPIAYEGQDKAGAAVAMRRTGRARARTVLLGALVLGVLCLPGCVDAHASDLGCSR